MVMYPITTITIPMPMPGPAGRRRARRAATGRGLCDCATGDAVMLRLRDGPGKIGGFNGNLWLFKGFVGIIYRISW